MISTKKVTTVNLGNILATFSRGSNKAPDLSRVPKNTKFPITSETPMDLAVSPLIADRHTGNFHDIITSDEPLSFDALKELSKGVELEIFNYKGARPASSTPIGTYGGVWFRDAALQALGLYEAGFYKEAEETLFEVAKYANSPKQRGKYLQFVTNESSAPDWYRKDNTNIIHPHIRADRNEKGEIVPPSQEWCNAQLDATGLWLWVTFKMANDEKLDLKRFDEELSRVTYEDGDNYNYYESILVLGLKFLAAIDAPNQADRGAWEEDREESRASSVAAVTAAAIEGRKYFNSKNWDPEQIISIDEGGIDYFMEKQRKLIKNGQHILEVRLPYALDETLHETKDRGADATFSWIMSSLRPSLFQNQLNTQDALITNMKTLIRPEGIIRYSGDVYLGESTDASATGHHYDKVDIAYTGPGFEPAVWGMFEDHLSAHYSADFVGNGSRRYSALGAASTFLKRGFATVSTEKTYEIPGKKGRQTVFIPWGRVPEGLFKNSDGNWVENRNTPLFMAEAARLQAIARYAKALGYERGLNAEIEAMT